MRHSFPAIPGTPSPKAGRVNSNSLAEPVANIIDAIKSALECSPPELSSDIVERGIILSGGSSQLKNLDTVIRKATDLPTQVAEDALLCVVKGTGKVLENLQKFRAVLFKQESKKQ